MAEQRVNAFLNTGPERAPYRLLLAHGAGAGMQSPFMEAIAALLAERGAYVTRFEFAYMAARRTGGARRPPPPFERLTEEYRDVLGGFARTNAEGQRLLIGGKSLGGRIASLIAADAYSAGLIDGLVCLGYPFHPPGRPGQLRTAHLAALPCPMLIVQGDRDPFGAKGELESYQLSRLTSVHWIGDGDHDFGPRGASGFTRKGNLADAAGAVAAFAAELSAPR